MSKKQGNVVKFPELNIENSQAEQHGKKRRSPLRAIVSAIAAVFVVCVVSAVIIHSSEESSGFFYRVTAHFALDKNDGGLSQVYQYQSGKENVYTALKNGLVMASETDVKYYNRNGDEVLSKSVDLESPAVASAGNTAVVYDRGGGSVTAFTGIRDVYEGSVDGSITSVSVSKSGSFAVSWRESGYRSSVTVFDGRGREVYYCGYTSGYATAAELSPNGVHLAVAVASQQDGAVLNRIDLYDMGSSEVKATKNIGDELVLDIGYADKKTICIVCENRLLFLDAETLGEKGKFSYGGMYLKDVSFGMDDQVVLLFNRYKGGGKCLVSIVGTDGEQIASYSSENEINSMDAGAGKVALLEDTSAVILDKELMPISSIDNFAGQRLPLHR